MGVTFSNKFSTTLSSGINNSVTSLSVVSATGFPSLSGGEHTYVTLDNGDSTTIEVVKVTNISSTTLTIIRAQDSTSAAAFSAGAKVELRLTSALLADVRDELTDDAVTYAKIQNVSATDRILGRDSASAGIIEEITPANVRTMINVADGANAYVHPNHSGDVTSSADGATTIAADAVTYAKMQNVSATDRVLGRDSSGAGIVEEIAPADIRTMINVADGANAYVHPNHSGEVTSTADGATVIADNIVDEANLKISNAGSNGQYLQKQSGDTGGLTWADAGGAYSAWLVKTEDGYTASSGDQLIANHASTAFTITLPSSPSQGDTVIFKNIGAALLTVGRGGKDINSEAADATLPTGNAAQLVFIDDTFGWVVL